MRRAVPCLLLVLTLAACASSSATAGGGGPNVITTAQLREIDQEGLNVLEVIQRLRPNWLRSRGTASFGGGAAVPRAIVDGVPYGEVEALGALSAREVEALEFIGAGDATTRFGTGYPGGAVLVRTR